jgi:calcium-dependent protein kinase
MRVRSIKLEFIRAAINKNHLLNNEKLEITFKLFDKDSSGVISQEELRVILGISSKYSDKVLNEVINQIDVKMDNEITFDDFLNMMMKLKY